MARQLLLFVLIACASSCAWARPKPPEYPAQRLDSGLIVHDLVVPLEGAVVRTGDEVSIDYLVRLDDGTVVDSSLETGQVLTFRVGDAQVPAGLDQGVEGMRLFGRRELIVPPHLAYGEAGLQQLIPPDATLRFEIELMEIRPESAPPEPEP